jgi:spore germination cell wall hydrolase CwlJ-like protein
MKKIRPWSSESKWFIPVHMVAMIITASLIFFINKAEASDANNEAFCLAQNMYFEAGNQPLAGKIAVSQVVINRTQHMNYPTDICGVVYQAKWSENWKGNMIPTRNQCQFSWFCDGKSDEPLDTDTFFESYVIASDVLMGKYPDITEGATHYHSIMVEPYWAETLNETVQITDHIFYK